MGEQSGKTKNKQCGGPKNGPEGNVDFQNLCDKQLQTNGTYQYRKTNGTGTTAVKLKAEVILLIIFVFVIFRDNNTFVYFFFRLAAKKLIGRDPKDRG